MQGKSLLFLVLGVAALSVALDLTLGRYWHSGEEAPIPTIGETQEESREESSPEEEAESAEEASQDAAPGADPRAEVAEPNEEELSPDQEELTDAPGEEENTALEENSESEEADQPEEDTPPAPEQAPEEQAVEEEPSEVPVPEEEASEEESPLLPTLPNALQQPSGQASDQFPVEALAEANIDLTPEALSEDERAIFGLGDLDPARAGFRTQGYSFVLNNSIEGYVSVITPRVEREAPETFNIVYNVLDALIGAQAEEGTNLSEVINTIGDENFYYNSASQADTVFVLVRRGEQILAFEYPRVYHPAVQEVIPQFFGAQ